MKKSYVTPKLQRREALSAIVAVDDRRDPISDKTKEKLL